MKNVDFTKVNQLANSFFNSSKSVKKAILVRSCENQGNLAGTISGWTDNKLTDYGRRQAFILNQFCAPIEPLITQVHSSDLQRCVDTSYYAMGFPSSETFAIQTRLLREMNFGDSEGLHFDGLSQEEKEEVNSPEYHAPGGESWQDVRERAVRYLATVDEGNHLVFTHGGPMTVCLSRFGVDEMPSNGSIAGVTIENQEITNMEFLWEFPVIEEDI